MLDHPIIPSRVFEDSVRHFGAIDTVLNLHFSSHVTPASLPKLLDSAASLCKKRINYSSLEVIIYISPQMYKIDTNESPSKYTITLPDSINISEFNKLMPLRKAQYVEDINTWIQNNPHMTTIPATLLQSLSLSNTGRRSPSKIVKSKLMDLKNDSSKYKFKEKVELKQQQLANGLSLLERIRLKEQLNKESNTVSPEEKYNKYIQGKLVSIYDIIYELSMTSTQTLSMKKLIVQIQDSLSYPISEKEIADIVDAICSKLENVLVITRGNVSTLRVAHLNRDEDVKTLQA